MVHNIRATDKQRRNNSVTLHRAHDTLRLWTASNANSVDWNIWHAD